MYEVDDKDTVHELAGLPQSSPGAPLPVVLSDEHSTFVAYLVHRPEPNWDKDTPEIFDTIGIGETIAIVQIVWRMALMFGPPNDEAFSGHPLASRGLGPYGVYEVLQSSWIRKLERMNSVHRHHDPKRYAELRHFVLSFHDSTFECVSKEVKLVELFQGSMREAVAKMASLFTSL